MRYRFVLLGVPEDDPGFTFTLILLGRLTGGVPELCGGVEDAGCWVFTVPPERTPGQKNQKTIPKTIAMKIPTMMPVPMPLSVVAVGPLSPPPGLFIIVAIPLLSRFCGEGEMKGAANRS